MKVLVVGGGGMLGNDVLAELARRATPFEAPSLEELDLTNPDSVSQIARQPGRFDWCINCAAYTAVDKAEEEKELAYAINAVGVGLLGGACNFGQTRLLHVSTDFVFDGSKEAPYLETDLVRPLGVYGASKQQGEEAALNYGGVVCRTAWLYGPNGGSFPRTMIRAWKAGKTLRVVSDQFGSPTYTGELARVLVDMISLESLEPGIYHAAGPDSMSWNQLAELAIETYSAVVEKNVIEVLVEPIKTEDWPTPAPRPAYSVLDSGKLQGLGMGPMKPTTESMKEFVKRLLMEV